MGYVMGDTAYLATAGQGQGLGICHGCNQRDRQGDTSGSTGHLLHQSPFL